MANDWEPGIPRPRRKNLARDTTPARPPTASSECRPTTDSNAPGAEEPHSVAVVPPLTTDDILDELESAAGLDDDGYYKVVPGGSGQSWYITFHFKYGRWQGHYVMAVVYRGALARGLAICARKVSRVRAGTLSPVRDKWLSR